MRLLRAIDQPLDLPPFGYVTIGTNDLGRAVSFYNAVLSKLGASQLYSTDRMGRRLSSAPRMRGRRARVARAVIAG